MRSTIRSLAWFAIAAQAAFVASWVVAGALAPGYSHSESGVSALAGRGMPHAWIVTAGLIVLGLSVAALAPGVVAVLPPRRAATMAALLFALAGLGFVVAALARVDCDLSQHACSVRFEDGELTWRTSLHLWSGLFTSLALIGTPFAIARALWPSPVAGLALGSGLWGLGLLVAAGLLYRATGAPDGIVERVQLAAAQIWGVIVAAGILHETRRAPQPSRPTPLRPRDFFGSSWAGEGQVQAWPYAFWRRFGPRFSFTRSTTWKSDDVGIVHDRAVFAGGRVEERLRFVHIVDPAHIHVTSDDMPDGLDVTVDEHGYSTSPYRVLVPVGPLRFIVRCRDETHLEADGTLVYDVRAAWHGLPVGRLAMRGRPVDTSPSPAAIPAAARVT